MSDLRRADYGLAQLLQFEHVAWFEDGKVRILDRRVYPTEIRYEICHSHTDVAQAIADMVTQSAGPYYAAAHGMTLAAWECRNSATPMEYLRRAAHTLSHARPTTAVRMEAITNAALQAAETALADGKPLVPAMQSFAQELMERRYRNIAKCASYLVDQMPKSCTLLTQCFAETVVGLFIREAQHRGIDLRLICPETRPFLQGARLTASVAHQQNCPVHVISDNMPGLLLSEGKIDLFTSAADAICMDGTVINKVGTYQIALCAKEAGVPYFVTGAPDRKHAKGSDVPIEQRDGSALLEFRGIPTTLPGVQGLYPAFDRTPGRLVTGVVTDRGVFAPDRLADYFTDNDDDFPGA